MGVFIDPWTDWGFKHIFGREASKLLCFECFSTTFWVVPLMPAICFHTTMKSGLLAPLKERLLDYHSTINLAGCSRLLPRYSFASIKCIVLVHYTSPIALTC